MNEPQLPSFLSSVLSADPAAAAAATLLASSSAFTLASSSSFCCKYLLRNCVRYAGTSDACDAVVAVTEGSTEAMVLDGCEAVAVVEESNTELLLPRGEYPVSSYATV